jgi:hypothetical protein
LVQLQGLELRGLKRLSMDFFKICGAKVDFKRILNNEQAMINLIHVQEELVSGTRSLHKDCEKKTRIDKFDL